MSNNEGTHVPDTFERALAAYDVARVEYESLAALRQKALETLQEHQCGETFTKTIEGPWGDGDVIDLDVDCELTRGHSGDHSDDDKHNDIRGEHLRALTRYKELYRSSAAAYNEVDNAAEVVESLQCPAVDRDGDFFTCLLPAGHEGQHDFPSQDIIEIRIV